MEIIRVNSIMYAAVAVFKSSTEGIHHKKTHESEGGITKARVEESQNIVIITMQMDRAVSMRSTKKSCSNSGTFRCSLADYTGFTYQFLVRNF